MEIATHKTDLARPKKKGIYIYFLIASTFSIALYVIEFFNAPLFHQIIQHISPNHNWKDLLTQPHLLFAHHFIINSWFEAILGIITLHFLFKNRNKVWPSSFIILTLGFQALQTFFNILLTNTFLLDGVFHSSVIPSLLAINLFVYWKDFNENFIDIPFSKRSITFYQFYFSIAGVILMVYIYNRNATEVITLFSSLFSAFLLGVSFNYFKKKPEPALNQYLQINFKTPFHQITMDASEMLLFEENKQKYLDYILDKINRVGVNRLSKREKEFLASFQDEGKTSG